MQGYFIFILIILNMCVLCWLTQSAVLLSIGYTPTQVDMEILNAMSQKVEIVAQHKSSLESLDKKVDNLKKKADKSDNKRAQYMIYALDDIVSYHTLFSK